MLRKYYSLAVASLLCGALQAQDIYKVETFSGSDLNGTARFVGMGGAMNDLGADHGGCRSEWSTTCRR